MNEVKTDLESVEKAYRTLRDEISNSLDIEYVKISQCKDRYYLGVVQRETSSKYWLEIKMELERKLQVKVYVYLGYSEDE